MTRRPPAPRVPRLPALGLTVLMTAGLAACFGGSDDDDDPRVAVGDTIALTASGKLISFNRATPGTLVGSIAIRGLVGSETLVGIDTRPADGRLHGLGSAGGLYVIDAATGVATRGATLRAATGDDNPYTALAGTQFGVDFNPVADRLRVVSDTGQSLRINVDTGDAITDGAITPTAGPASVTAAGYTNSFAGASTTQLFVLDAAAGQLYLQDPPNNGTLGTPRPLGVTGGVVNGFDIDARDNAGYAAFGTGSTATLYRVDVITGAATAVGAIGGGEAVRGLALVGPAAPVAIGLTPDNRLVTFDPKSPNTITATTAISGLGTGETVVGIDVRPADRLLYALGSGGRVYTVDTTTGVATWKATLAADPADATAPYAGLSGTVFSVDFNPAADRLRVISETGQSLRINVDTGATTTDGTINRAGTPPSVVGAAYTNSFAGTTATTLFDIDAASGVLARQNPPNDGTLVDVGVLGAALNGAAPFDIAGGDNGLALAALRPGTSGPFSLYTVSLTTGAATLYRSTGAAALSQIGGAGGPALRDLAIRY